MARSIAITLLCSVASGCSSHSSAATYTVGGWVTGLAGNGLVLTCGPSRPVAISTNGAFSCTGRWTPGEAFAVEITAQPKVPAQTCEVRDGAGTVQDANVVTVEVTCTTDRFRVGGVVRGLAGTDLTLQLNRGEELVVAGDGPFWFTETVPSGGTWGATVSRQPVGPSQTCSVTNGEGTIEDADAASAVVDCRTNAYAIGGRVAGLAGIGLVLQNGLDTLDVASDGAFRFATPVASGASYFVTVARQPSSPSQACTVVSGLGVVGGEDVTSVAVRCATRYAVGGTIEGLAGSGLVLALDVGRIETLPIASNGPFQFGTRLDSGTTFEVTVATHPVAPAQRCEVAGGRGVVAAADVSVDVACDVAPPAIASFSPSSGAPGTTVTLDGSGLADASSVRFGDVSAAFAIVSDARITAVVPAGAVSAPIAVTTPAGTAISGAPFTVTPTELDLSVAAAYVTQAIAGRASPATIVAGRPGLLRVFVVASGPNAAAPRLSVQLVSGGHAQWTRIIDAPGGSVPVAVAEAELSRSWNVPLGPDDLPGGAESTLELAVDPDDLVPERDETNNDWTLRIAPEAVPRLDVTLVPIVLSSGTGRVDEVNKPSWIDRLVRMFPISSIDVRVRAPFTPSVSSVQSDGAGWDVILAELGAARAVEAPDRLYFGALRAPYARGVAGLGALGEPVALGWDRSDGPDGANYPEVLAHELGHNFGRFHAPCGGPDFVDPDWPRDTAHREARIGTWGWDVHPQTTSATVLKDPAVTFDVMSYCNDVWASDYTYEGVLRFRQTARVPAAAVARRGLLVTGVERDGRLTLQPAFVVDALPSVRAGALTLELRDRAGVTRATSSLDVTEVLDGPAGLRLVSSIVPLDGVEADAVATVVVSRGGVEIARIDRSGRPPVASAKARREAPDRARVEWDGSAYPLVMVRDARTGEVVAFGRGGHAAIATTAPHLELHLSDGVSSSRQVMLVE